MNDSLRQPTQPTTRWTIPTAWAVLILFDVAALALACAQETVRTAEPPVISEQRTVTQIDGPVDGAETAVRFEALDVFLDSGEIPLAAYQLELSGRKDQVTIVGIEGGEHPAFAEPPSYDPRAMNHNRAVLAAFHTGRDLPAGRSRVARVHLQIRGSGMQEYETILTASADAAGQRVPAKISIQKAGG